LRDQIAQTASVGKARTAGCAWGSKRRLVDGLYGRSAIDGRLL